MIEESLLGKMRSVYQSPLPDLFKDLQSVAFTPVEDRKPVSGEVMSAFFHTHHLKPHILQLTPSNTPQEPLVLGVVFSGGPAAGGHTVLAGLLDGLKRIHPKSRLIGFLGGFQGVLKNFRKEISEDILAPFRHQGGFDLIGTGRTKIETDAELEASFEACKDLDGLIVVGGDDSNTNAAILADYFLKKKSTVSVIGVPKTIDGDLKSEEIEISFGFDSACKTYSEMIGNIARDAISVKKYYHFIKLMGRSASHICLECALATHPNLALIGEENKSLGQIVEEITDLIVERSRLGKGYGIVLVPEGLIEFIPELSSLLKELEFIGKEGHLEMHRLVENLSPVHRATFLSLPKLVQEQFLLGRDPHGNLKVSQIDTQKILIALVQDSLKKKIGYTGIFYPQEHFFGYEGRCCFPSNFDADYCYVLGLASVLAVRDRLTGSIICVQHLSRSVDKWSVKAVPLVQFIHFEERKGKRKAVIQKAMVDLKGHSFSYFSSMRKIWALEDQYCSPGPTQFFGDTSLADSRPSLLKGF